MASDGDALRLLFVKLGIDVPEADIKKANQTYTELKSKIDLVVGAARMAWGAVKELTTGYAEHAMAVRALAMQLGAGTDALQELQYAASVTESSAEAMNRGLLFLSRTAGAAAKGSKEAASSFSGMGVSLRDASGKMKDPAALMKDVAAAFKKMPDGAEKAALAMKLFGRGGAKLIPTLNLGREGLAALGAEGRELGVVLTEDAIKAAAKFDDEMDVLKAGLTGVKNTIAGELMPIATEVVHAMVAWMKANREWIKQRIHQAVTMVSKALKDLKQILDPVLAIIGAVVKSSWALWAVLTALASVAIMKAAMAMGGLVQVLAQLRWAHIKAAAAALSQGASTFLLGLKWMAIGAIIALVIEDIYTFITGGDSMIGLIAEDLSKAIDEFWAAAKFDPKATGWDTFLSFLNTVLWTVTHIGETIDEWSQLLQGKGVVANYIKNAVLPSVFGAPAGYAAGTPAPVTDEVRQSFFGGGASPAAAAAAGGPGAKALPPVTINIPLQTAANAQDVANAVRPVVRDELSTVFRQAAKVHE